MNDRHDNLVSNGQTPDLLQQCWSDIAELADRIADEVDIKSEGLSGNFRKQTLAISNFFRSGCEYEKALNQSSVLAIANPLARLVQQSEDGKISPSDLSTAVHLGMCTLSRHGSDHRNLFRLFLYPILLTYFVGIGGIFAAHFLFSPFSEMYSEFGIALPRMTQLLLDGAYFVRTYTITLLLVLFGVPPLLWLFNWIGHEKREPGMSRLDQLLATRRPAVARWLLHVSLLIEAGVDWSESIQRASSLSGKKWIRRRAAKHAKRVESGSDDASWHFFCQRRFHMADTAVLAAVNDGAGVTLLQQVATWYRDTSSNIMEWIVQLLIPIYITAILVSIILVVFSLFAPLFSIISGLTGGGAGGIM